jgi:DNA-binding HxlR family transcriptional regulator
MSPSGAKERSPASVAIPARSPETPWEEIDQCFRDHREAAVRLVERVNDLLASARPAQAPAANDLSLVRSVFGKWSMEVLLALHAAPSAGFEELRRSLPGITPRVLSLKLKGLEQHGMVRREVIHTRPPRVRYTPTELGWTVAWLSRPVLLFLDQSAMRQPPAPDPTPPSPA